MSPLRSIAGPATVRMPTPSSSRMMYASDVLPRPGRAGEQDVVERLAPRPSPRRARSTAAPSRAPGRRSRRAGAAGASARAPSSSRQELGAQECDAHAAFCNACAHALLRRQLGIDARRARARRRRPSSRARRARRGRRDPHRRRARRRPSPSFSFSSSTTRCAVFLPMPGIASKRAVSSSAIARRSSARRRAGDDRERDLRPDAVDAEQVDEEVALLASSRSRRAAARPRARGGTSRPSARPRRGAAPTASPGRGSRRR